MNFYDLCYPKTVYSVSRAFIDFLFLQSRKSDKYASSRGNPLTTIAERKRELVFFLVRKSEKERKGLQKERLKVKMFARTRLNSQATSLFLILLLESFCTLVDLGRCILVSTLEVEGESRFNFEWIRWWERDLSLSLTLEWSNSSQRSIDPTYIHTWGWGSYWI